MKHTYGENLYSHLRQKNPDTWEFLIRRISLIDFFIYVATEITIAINSLEKFIVD